MLIRVEQAQNQNSYHPLQLAARQQTRNHTISENRALDRLDIVKRCRDSLVCLGIFYARED